jgi:hypothetical protein
MRTPIIDITMLRTEIWGDAAQRDDARARQIVEYIRRRFPAVRYGDTPEDADHVDRPALDPEVS